MYFADFFCSFAHCIECCSVYCIKIFFFFSHEHSRFQEFLFNCSAMVILKYLFFCLFHPCVCVCCLLLPDARSKCQLLLISLSWCMKWRGKKGDVCGENSTKCGVLFAHLINHTKSCVCQSPNACLLRSWFAFEGFEKFTPHSNGTLARCDHCAEKGFSMRVHTIDVFIRRSLMDHRCKILLWSLLRFYLSLSRSFCVVFSFIPSVQVHWERNQL